ncbi:MAG: hypothetical protein ACD_80C00013G0014 [uncultured bacterium (gcode 4)]|uniref:Uncharacterized protein n=1 Tax=uncultured bacterium (gcode 4) TaxID=1234023 RepID=K1YJS8_9BACT|nr:MAG: hypothetical protein ACD_80C00013G0014 [uncultured bacterium (gcode 4)]HBB04872.1 hypothetical protein [Candidatus Gracilibacteria bacterium]
MKTIKTIIAKLDEYSKKGICTHCICTWKFTQGNYFEKDDTSAKMLEKFKSFKQLTITTVGEDRLYIEMNGLGKPFDFNESDKKDNENYEVIIALISEFIQ